MTRHHYRDCGLPNVFIRGESFERRRDFGDVFQIPAIQVLHTIIALSIVLRDFKLSRLELKFLRTEFGYDQSSWSKHFGVSVEQTSAWESGVDQLPLSLELRIRRIIFKKIWERSEKYLEHFVDIKDEIERAQPIIDELPQRVLRNAADREIEISHDGGGVYRLVLD